MQLNYTLHLGQPKRTEQSVIRSWTYAFNGNADSIRVGLSRT